MLLPFWAFPVLYLTGLVAGVVDSVAGGGGLIALPVLLMFGLPAPIALGTNKLQSMCGTFTATRHYGKAKAIDWPSCRLGAVGALVGSLTGAILVQSIKVVFLNKLIPCLIAVIFFYTLFRPNLGTKEHPPKMKAKPFYLGAGLALGFYDGFFGPGVGSFWTIALILGLGFEFLKATGTTKLMNFSSNVAAVAVFALLGHIYWLAGIAMSLGQLSGARLGANLAVKKGARFVRPLFLTMVGLTLAKLLYAMFFP